MQTNCPLALKTQRLPDLPFGDANYGGKSNKTP